MSYRLDQEQIDFYQTGGVADDYELVSGVFELPLAVEAAAGQSPVVVVEAHAPYRRRVIRFGFTKQVTPPVVPKPVSSGAFTFVGGSLSIPSPTPNLNGSFEWTVTGEYIFVSTVNVGDDDGYILSGPPLVYPSQIQSQTGSGTQSSQPEDVQVAGIGPKVGWQEGQQVDLTNPSYSYNEPSYLPAIFFSESLIAGPDSYPNL